MDYMFGSIDQVALSKSLLWPEDQVFQLRESLSENSCWLEAAYRESVFRDYGIKGPVPIFCLNYAN